LFVRVSPVFKQHVEAYCAKERLTVNEAVVDALGKYIGIDTSTEDSVLGSLLTQRRVTDEMKDRLDMLTELFMTFVEYYFTLTPPLETVHAKREGIKRADELMLKFLERYRVSLEGGGRLPDIIHATPGSGEEDLVAFSDAAADMEGDVQVDPDFPGLPDLDDEG
jgi:hypothetical protein